MTPDGDETDPSTVSERTTERAPSDGSETQNREPSCVHPEVFGEAVGGVDSADPTATDQGDAYHREPFSIRPKVVSHWNLP